MNIYTKEGWIDVPHIVKICDKNKVSFVVIIGKRQVGKTYGVLKYMLDNDKRFILMRRVKPELDMLTKGVNSPFEAIKGYEEKIIFAKESEYTATIERIDGADEEDTEKKTRIGTGVSLTTVGKIRGFNGSLYSDVVFDEAIPEEHLYKVSNEGDAFLNAYTTIAGNRELEGKEPLRMWILANANTLDSQILSALNIIKDVEKMSLRGDESKLLSDRGILILLPESKGITEKRKKTALYRAIGGDSKFSKMAYENEFSYNDYTDVRSMPLKEYKLLITIGDLSIHLHKNDKTLYITDKSNQKAKYTFTDSDTHISMFNRKFSDIRIAYLNGRCIFQDMRIKNIFLNYICI